MKRLYISVLLFLVALLVASGGGVSEEITNSLKMTFRLVKLEDRQFYIGVTLVTNKQYAACVSEDYCRAPTLPRPGSDYVELDVHEWVSWQDSEPPSRREKHPVVAVSMKDALSFATWLGKREGRSYRLPTEAEWRAAAKGTPEKVYPWRSDGSRFDYYETAPVAEDLASESLWGIRDMNSNVWEWAVGYEGQPALLRLMEGYYPPDEALTFFFRWYGSGHRLCLPGFRLVYEPEIPNPDTLVYATYGSVNTLDPAYSYDTASGGVIFNVMENLVSWPYGVVDADETDISYSLDTTDLLPMLATVVPTVDNGLITENPDGSVSYAFPMRNGVVFHDGRYLTPEDVEYSFERGMLQDRDGGPMWMLLEPLTGKPRLYQVVEEALGIDTNQGELIPELSPGQQAQVYDWIDPTVEVDGEWVIFRLPRPYAPFLSILAHGVSAAAILDKEWCIENGSWDSNPDTWAAWYNPGGAQAAEDSELYKVINGTGPYMLEHWDPGVEVVYERFDGYWREPAAIKTVVNKKIQEWSDRLLMLQSGDADICEMGPQYLPQVMRQEGIVTTLNLPTLGLDPVGFFTSDLAMEGNDLVGSGKWAEDGIPSEFFNDAHARKAFAYAFEYQTYIDEVLRVAGGYRIHGPIPKAFAWAYDDDPAIYYNYDMEKAEAEMKLAHDGRVWQTGFTFTLLYNEGNQTRRFIAETLKANIESISPKFHIEVRGVPWSTYLDCMMGSKLPLFVFGWLADFPDPHNFVVPFVLSDGFFPGMQGTTLRQMFAERYDPLIYEAVRSSDRERRAALYRELQWMSFEDCYALWVPQANGYRVMRDWVQGWAFNPVFPGVYYYSLYKAYE